MPDLTAFAQSNTAARIRGAASRGALAHALIFSGAQERADAARYAAAAFECVSEGDRPCLTCAHCRKVMAGIHPDVLYVRDPEHKELSAEVVRAARSDAFIRPNEGERKVYIFEDCAVLNERDQNIMLKTIEDGPPYCAFIFCAENSAALLQTIRSRCIELKLGASGADAESEDEARERAAAFCRLLAEGNAASRVSFLVKLENAKPKREELGAFFESARLMLADALLSLYAAADAQVDAALAIALSRRLGKAKLTGMLDLLDDYRRSCRYNVGVGVTLGGFSAECEDILAR